MNINVENYFSFENNIFFDASNLMDNLNEEFVLEGENYLIEEGIDTSNIYFKLLAQLYYLKNEDNVMRHLFQKSFHDEPSQRARNAPQK